MIDGYSFYYWNVAALPIYRLFIKDKKRFLFVACLQFFLILAVRSIEVGIDSWEQYPVVYRNASRLSFVELLREWSLLKQIAIDWPPAESGFYTLNWIFGHLLGLPYRALLIFLALIASIALYKYLNRNSYSPLLGAMTAFVYLMNNYVYFSAIRRSTALTIILFALMAYEDKKITKAALLLLLATTMHRSAMIFFLFLPFANVTISRKLFQKTILAIIAAIIIAIPLSRTVLPVLLMSLGKAGYFFKSNGMLAQGVNLEMKAAVGIIILAGIYYCVDFRLLNTDYNNMLCKVFLLIIIFSPIQAVVPLLTQIHNYFTLSCYLLVSNIIVQRREDIFIKRMMQLVVVVVLILVLQRNVNVFRHSHFYYYSTVWNSNSGL